MKGNNSISDVNFVNIKDLTLHHGKRYRVCLHVNATNINHEEWTQELPEISACSDGVVVDITPPLSGQVWIGWQEHTQYQVIRYNTGMLFIEFV